MKPYYEEAGIAIYHGDCREILPSIKADVCITDPPYGIDLSNHDTTGRTDRVPIAISDYRVRGDADSSVALSVLEWCASGEIPTVAFASPKNPWSGEWRQWLVWSKGGAVGGGGDIATCWKFDWELIQVARTGRLNGPRESSVLNFVVRQNDFIHHPTEKPLGLMKYLVNKVTSDSMKILDPFMGSGTTLVAAKSLGRAAVGVDIEEKYCEIAANRLRQSVLSFEEGS